ncbi:MAG TPA: FkbM family methyltransferase [Thermoanaerobaculia bacterium]|nr:FkbM family methyltransferase [Thermoanaerobaculia bacterium]
MSLLSWLRKLDSKRRNRKKRPEMAAFQEAVERLSPGDIAIDCGANVGIYTELMAKSGATVYAFEPNRAAYDALLANTAQYPNVKAFHAAVTTEPGPVKLYLHKWADDDPVHWSTGSSLIAGKKNVRTDHFSTVDGISLSQFIKDLGGRVRILKMDIEGAEVGILNRLLDEGLHERIDQAFVEVHDRKVRELVEPTQKLRDRLRALGVTHFRLDWR